MIDSCRCRDVQATPVPAHQHDRKHLRLLFVVIVVGGGGVFYYPSYYLKKIPLLYYLFILSVQQAYILIANSYRYPSASLFSVYTTLTSTPRPGRT